MEDTLMTNHRAIRRTFIVSALMSCRIFSSTTWATPTEGEVVGWGADHAAMTVPAGIDFTAIASGFNFNLALRSDGSLVGWGSNDFGQSTVPAGSNFVAIAAGRYHSLALKTDGSLVGWGQSDWGQTTVPA